MDLSYYQMIAGTLVIQFQDNSIKQYHQTSCWKILNKLHRL